ncbi:hypothetical protein ACFE04_000765 [Oxalis oulophora]
MKNIEKKGVFLMLEDSSGGGGVRLDYSGGAREVSQVHHLPEIGGGVLRNSRGDDDNINRHGEAINDSDDSESGGGIFRGGGGGDKWSRQETFTMSLNLRTFLLYV